MFKIGAGIPIEFTAYSVPRGKPLYTIPCPSLVPIPTSSTLIYPLDSYPSHTHQCPNHDCTNLGQSKYGGYCSEFCMHDAKNCRNHKICTRCGRNYCVFNSDVCSVKCGKKSSIPIRTFTASLSYLRCKMCHRPRQPGSSFCSIECGNSYTRSVSPTTTSTYRSSFDRDYGSYGPVDSFIRTCVYCQRAKASKCYHPYCSLDCRCTALGHMVGGFGF